MLLLQFIIPFQNVTCVSQVLKNMVRFGEFYVTFSESHEMRPYSLVNYGIIFIKYELFTCIWLFLVDEKS